MRMPTHQIKNIAGNLEYRKALEDLRKVMDEWQCRTGDTVPPLDKGTPDRFDRRTGKPIHGRIGRPLGGITPGEEAGAEKINDPGPR